jgi:hypothetical protein
MRARWWTAFSLVLALAVLANWLPQLAGEVNFFRTSVWPLLRQWSDPVEQTRLGVGPDLFDALAEADRRIPIDASVVLLTAGQDVDGSEYVAFHRALYYLSPRSVWWVVESPAVSSPKEPHWWRALADQPGVDWLVRLGSSSPGDNPPNWWAGPDWPFRVALALLVVLAAGWALLAGIERLGLRPRPSEAWVLSWVLGCVGVSLGLLLGCGLGLGLRGTSVVMTALALGGCAWVRRRQVIGRRLHWPPGLSRTSVPLLVCLSVAAPVVLYVALLADGRPLQIWDSWVTWGMKARLIWQTDTIPPAVYADPSRAVTLLSYPLLLPLLEAWLYAWVGAPDDRLAGLVVVGAYAALLGAVYIALRGRGIPAWLATAGVVYVCSIWTVAGLAGLAFADVPLALFALVAGIYLVRWLVGGPPGALVVAAVASGALGWTKREGLVLFALLVAASLVASRRWRTPATLALGGLVVAGPWLAFIAWRGAPDWQFVTPSPAIAFEHRDRLGFVFGTLARWSIEPGWSFVWPLGVLGLLLVPVRGPRSIDLLPLVAAGYLAVMGASYLFSAFLPYETHVLASLGRLMAHVAPLVAVWLLCRWCDPDPDPDLRVTPVPVPRLARDGAAPPGQRGSSVDHRTPEAVGRETDS